MTNQTPRKNHGKMHENKAHHIQHEPILSEHEVKKLFHDHNANHKKPNKFGKIFKEIIEWLLLAIAIFIVAYAIINWPSIYAKIDYFYKTKIKHETYSSQDISSLAITPSNNSDNNSNKNPDNVSYLPNNRLYIDKIGVNAPIIWNVAEDQIVNQLANGVVQYAGTALPDQGKGNVFITGHSSGYWWNHDAYNEVFALLDNLSNGDKIALTYNGKKYTYEVYNKVTVNPDQLEVLQNSQDNKMLSLMTCVPVGTSLRRLVVQAKIIADQNIDAQVTPATNSAPASVIVNTNNNSVDHPQMVIPYVESYQDFPDYMPPAAKEFFLPHIK